ncbi:MAG: glycosyl hydrolase [Thermoguttaceae bacterium]
MQLTSKHFHFVIGCLFLLVLAGGGSALAQDSSTNSNVPRGWKNPSLNRDSFWNEFRTPPGGFGNVAFYWWLGDPLTKERLAWQLERLANSKTSGLQINYAHSDKGGQLWGLTYESDPPLFSDAWWELVKWYVAESDKNGIGVSLSDYTLGISQGWKWDEAIAAYPEIIGASLRCESIAVKAGESFSRSIPDDTVSVSVFVDGVLKSLPFEPRTELRWTAPANFGAKLYLIRAVRVNPSIDPMHPKSGKAVVEKFFQPFEDKNPNQPGKGVNFFFSDELDFRVNGRLWNSYFAEEFQKRKGYDVRPELAALFDDVGPRTVKIRLDYNDVMVALQEENYFKPVFDWHQQRGMTYGCDHGGRGRDVMEFGDYFRTQRWNQGPGSDQPGLGRDIVKTKVAASIAHLYERPRVWLEGYYGSGWGTSSEQVVDATWVNFLNGYNLLTLHGLYYSTHGGWWEWAPPCNHFRMPYWNHFKEFLTASERLSYLFTQGNHVCDVAVLYPVVAAEAGIDANVSIQTAFDVCNKIYRSGIDLDFIDFESIERATIADGRLEVAGESYRVLVLPHSKVLRHGTLEKVVAFAEAGGIVVSIGALPEFSDRLGANDPEVKKLAEKLPQQTHYANADEAVKGMNSLLQKDVTVATANSVVPYTHRKIADQDVYAFYQLPANAEVTMRVATGKPELWDVWTGEKKSVTVLEQSDSVGTRIALENDPADLVIVVFAAGKAEVSPARPEPKQFRTTPVDGLWQTQIVPTLDNSFGDFRIPAVKGEMIGPEARRFRYATTPVQNADAEMRWQTYAFGPKFRQLGPLPGNMSTSELDALESQLVSLEKFSQTESPATVAGKQQPWHDYNFSWRYGVEGDAGHQGYHGLKENMYDTFIRLGKYATSGHLETVRQPEDGGTRYYLWTTILAPRDTDGVLLTHAMQPSAVWIRNQKVDLSKTTTVPLVKGANSLLLRYDSPGIGYFTVVTPDSEFATEAKKIASSSAASWSQAAFWIWDAPGEGAGDVYAVKSFEVDSVSVKSAVLRVTADDEYTAYFAGKSLGSNNSWNRIQQFDVTGLVKQGTNVIAIHGHNAAGPRGLIAELTIQFHDGQIQVIPSDSSWNVSSQPITDWQLGGAKVKSWKRATELSGFASSLWETHSTMGPPKLDDAISTVSQAATISHETTGPLAMRWYDANGESLKRGVLPYDIYAGETVAGIYQVACPPGAKTLHIHMPRSSSAKVVSATLQSGNASPQPLPITTSGLTTSVQLPQASKQEQSVFVKMELSGGEYGGGVFAVPMTFDCGEGEMPLGDWSQMPSLETYSGGIVYGKTVSLDPSQFVAGKRTILDLGRVVSSAEVFVNGKPAGIRVASPWKFDITDLIKPGDNTIDVHVYNTLGNHYITIPTRYRGQIESGLIGPVTILQEVGE